MAEVLTVAEIEARFAGEWVLLGDPQTAPDHKIHAGTVLHHSKDRDEVYRKAVALRPSRFAFLYTGTMPDDTAIVL
jgi:hypothetical protein